MSHVWARNVRLITVTRDHIWLLCLRLQFTFFKYPLEIRIELQNQEVSCHFELRCTEMNITDCQD